MRALVAVILASAFVAGCSPSPYSCSVDEQCVDKGVAGRCEPQGFCSFPDGACPSGSRFESNAGDLGGQCVAEGNTPDAPPEGFPSCGAAGDACCPDGSCLDNSFCESGTCKQCVTEVVHGITHSCFIRHDSTLWCSGDNPQGQLGNGGTATIEIATPVQVRDDNNAPITDAIAIGAGENYSCAIRADKTLWCWGANDNCADGGQLGDGTIDRRDSATQVIRESDGQPLTDIAEVYGAFCHTCARDSGGGVWCWGTNENGRLGDGTLVSKTAAVQVLDAPAGTPITGTKSLVMGANYACVITATDGVSCWGENDVGQLGDGTTTERTVPTTIAGLTVLSLTAGRFHACALNPDHTVACWGRSRHARLGNGSNGGPNQLTPAPVIATIGDGTPFADVAKIEAGAMSLVVTTNGDAYGWGLNLYGQTGTGGGASVPNRVLDARGEPLTLVSRLIGRFNRACAFRATGELLCWGRNTEGQLGDETFDNHGLAVPGAGPSCP